MVPIPAPIYGKALNSGGYFSPPWVQWFSQVVYSNISNAQPGTLLPLVATVAGAVGTGIPYSREDHQHPSQTHNDLPGRGVSLAHPAGSVTFPPSGGLVATDVQAAIQELDAAKQPIDADLTAIAAITETEGILTKTAANTWALIRSAQSGFGVTSQPSYADNGNGTVTMGSGVYALSSAADGDARPVRYTIAGSVKTPVDGSLSYLVANYNGGSPILTIISDVATINETTVIPVRTFFRTGNEIHQLDWDTLGLAKVDKVHQSIVKTQRFRRQSGLALSEVATRTIAVTSGIVWYGATALLNAEIGRAHV